MESAEILLGRSILRGKTTEENKERIYRRSLKRKMNLRNSYKIVCTKCANIEAD